VTSDAPKLLLDFQELADALGVHLSQIYRWRDRGELPLPIVRLGRSSRVRTVDVEAWLARLADDASTDTRLRKRTPAGTASEAGVASINRQVRRGSRRA
jgi:excisionase family DNA binding protein